MTTKPLRSSDPLLAASLSHLWPVLKPLGYVKASSRSFAREVNGFLHRVALDAGGVSGRSSTHVMAEATPICAHQINGYIFGGRIEGGSWNMSTHADADRSMQDVVTKLKHTVQPWMDELSSLEAYLATLEAIKHQREYVTLSRAIAQTALGHTNAARALLVGLKQSTFPYYTDKDGPVQSLLMAIDNAMHQELLKTWTVDNRLRYKLQK